MSAIPDRPYAEISAHLTGSDTATSGLQQRLLNTLNHYHNTGKTIFEIDFSELPALRTLVATLLGTETGERKTLLTSLNELLLKDITSTSKPIVLANHDGLAILVVKESTPEAIAKEMTTSIAITPSSAPAPSTPNTTESAMQGTPPPTTITPFSQAPRPPGSGPAASTAATPAQNPSSAGNGTAPPVVNTNT